jgi:benzoyl-CoA reductase/2-hydroxyglutaryl-CoA dehydratase subunit BcrC/BadD/HgdB
MREAGTATVVYACPYVPAEWIAAHGLAPERVVPSVSPAGGESASDLPVYGVCPYARAFAADAAARPATGVIFTTLCDQMRRMSELAPERTSTPVFLLNVPKTWGTPVSRRLYLDELRRLGRFLGRIGGRTPSEEHLARIVDEWREKRAGPAPGCAGTEDRARRVALVGAPASREDDWLVPFVEQSGGRVVLDATETGELGEPAPLDETALRADPLGELARAYLAIPHPARRPNNAFHSWLKERLSTTRARGVILRRFVWCDTWHVEVQRLRESLSLPLVEIDAGAGPDARSRTALQSLLEASA